MSSSSKPLPYNAKFSSADDYISSLLDFITSSTLHQALCGGVHILDFLTREPDLYTSLLPEDWPAWFSNVPIDDVLDLLLREDLELFQTQTESWRGHALPPRSLLIFIKHVRDLCLERTYTEPFNNPALKLDRTISVGMNIKKEHEVSHFAAFISGLTSDVERYSITHLVDFGSGQNYLGRVLAGPDHKKRVLALEGRPRNIDVARKMDVSAGLSEKKAGIWRNKKQWREGHPDTAEEDRLAGLHARGTDEASSAQLSTSEARRSTTKNIDNVHDRVTYIEHHIKDGDLSDVTKALDQDYESTPKLMVISLHSCGNLVHHGLRSLTMNPEVKAVAMIGCCYNLCTERLGSATYKLPTLHMRSANQRLTDGSLTCDPNGFPMSNRFLTYSHGRQAGIRFNITARMMAVQAPLNWTKDECESFFTRHFYRALLQRIFLDTGFVNTPVPADEVVGGSIRGWAGGTEPIIIGRLSGACYKSFVAYVRGAVRKICTITPSQGTVLVKCFESLSDRAISAYEQRYLHKRHDICVLWSLMSFAAQLVECTIVADRWQFLMEQDEVAEAWVQTVFDYRRSPRNLAIIGIKK